MKAYSVAAGSHTVTITVVSGLAYVYGVRGTNPTGVIVDNYSQSSATSATYMTGSVVFGDPILWCGGPSLPSDLVISALGVNDARALGGAAASADAC